MKKKVAKIPYEGYTLPPSAEKGGSFVDFKQAYKEAPTKVPVKRIKVVKRGKKRSKVGSR
jgi:hypothetical protein|tara:strand:- start:899 stop:1078 length:180 start_codon:yes stop_codon:yes gene_type:complete